MNLNPLGSLLGNLIVCGLIQVTLVAVVATLASRFIHWRKGSSMPLLQAALAVIVLLTIAVIVPMPSWLQPQANTIETSSVQNGSSVPNTEEANPTKSVETTPKKTDNKFGLREAFAAGLEGIRNLNQQPETKPIDQPQEVSTAFSWTTVFLALFSGGVVLGLIRLVGGLIGVKLLVNSSRPISNAKLLESVDLLAAQTRCVKTVVIHESGLVESAATVGWRRPVILLSQNWRDWTDDQLRSVLAHELAHVSRGDFLTTVLAQLGLVLHFYHPLVHWLVGRMRLEQELAADAIAAQAVGDPRIYLRAIGELALAQSSEQLSWPAHTFLPTRKTFLRRIEMLRDMKLLSGSVPIALRVCSVCVMLGVALVAVGIRPTTAIAVAPMASLIEPQQAGLGAASTPTSESVEAHFVPADAIAVALVRTQELIPTLEKIVQAAGPSNKDDTLKLLVQSLKKCNQITIIVGPLEQASNEPFGIALEFADKASRDSAITQLTPATQLTKETYLSYEYERFGSKAK
ncbi:MAG: M56 family metallopeptidase [Pirellulales bacterium]